MSHYRPYPVYKDSGVEWAASAPEHWRRCRLKHVVGRLEQGWSPQCETRPAEPDEWGVLKVGCVNGGVFNPGENKALPLDVEPQQGLSLRKGDVLVSRANTRELVGGCALVERDYPKLILCDKLYRLRPERSTTSDYLSRLVQVFGRAEVEVEASGTSASMVNISMETVRNLRIVVPPYSEQAEITPAIDRETARIDALIAKKTRFIELLKEKRQALITHAVTKGLDPRAKMKDSGVEWIGAVPEHWRVERLAALYREAVRPGDAALPVLSISIHDGISDDELSPEERDRQVYQIEDRTKYKRVKPNDLAYNMMRAWQGAFGAVQVDGLVSPAYVVAEAQDDTRSAYIEQLLRTPMAVEEMRRFSRGIADFRMRLYWEYFRDLKVCVPPASEQDRILSALEKSTTRIDMLTAKTEHSIALLQERRAALITAAVTGQIDLRSPTESPP